MVSIGRLYGPAHNGRVEKNLVIARLSGVDIDYDSNFKFGVDNKTSEYLAKFPLGQTPAFEGKDGILLTESACISLYVASQKENNSLLGKSKSDYSKILQYAFYAETQIVPFFLSIYLPILGFAPYNEDTENTAYAKVDRALAYLNKELQGKEYLVGDNLTIADVLIFFSLETLFKYFLGIEDREPYPNVNKFITNIAQIPEVKQSIGELKFADTRKKYNSKV